MLPLFSFLLRWCFAGVHTERKGALQGVILHGRLTLTSLFWQLCSFGDHNGKGFCLCKFETKTLRTAGNFDEYEDYYDPYDDSSDDTYENLVPNPECPVTGGKHQGEVHSVAFSPDGKRIVSGAGDKLVKIWDAASGAEVISSMWVCAEGATW